MTIKLADLHLPKESQHSYCGENNMDLIPMYVSILRRAERAPWNLYMQLMARQVEMKIVSAVRFAAREEFEVDMIPQVVELRCGPLKAGRPQHDQFGNSWFVTVQYHTRGWLMTAGGRERPDGTMEWQLYMD